MPTELNSVSRGYTGHKKLEKYSKSVFLGQDLA